MQKIILGLDIGTQFCYAGYVDDTGRFVQAIVPDSADSYDADEVEKNGIPTMFAYNTSRNIYCWGSDAARKIAEGARGWITDETSIKERVREQMQEGNPDAKFVLSGSEVQHDLMNMFEKLVKYIAEEIKHCLDGRFPQGWRITKVNFAYPDVTDEALGVEEYRAKLADIIRDVFRFGGVHPVVDSKSEAMIVANCLGKRSTKNRHFCTVDVGAGTTDVIIMKHPEDAVAPVQDGVPYSCTFGGKRIDELLHKCGVCQSTMHAQGMLDNKKWLFTGEGEPASGVESGARIVYMNQVISEVTSLAVWNNLCKRLTTYYRPKVDCDTTVVLLGGSSVVPFVRNKVKEIFRDVADVVALEDWAAQCGIQGITNSNFVAYAAADLDQGGELPPPEFGHRQTLAVKDTNNNYYILADATTPNHDYHYYITPDPWREVYPGTRTPTPTFDPTTSLYILHLKVELNGKDQIKANETDKYIEKEEEYKGYIGVKNKLPQSANGHDIRYYYGTVMNSDFKNPDWGKLHLYLFDNTAENTCYYDAEKQKPYSYAAFVNMSARSDAEGGISENPGLSHSNKVTGRAGDRPTGTGEPVTIGNRSNNREPVQSKGKMTLLIMALVMGFLGAIIGAICLGQELAAGLPFFAVGVAILISAVVAMIYQSATHGSVKRWFPLKK